jgi:hypothetical protein
MKFGVKAKEQIELKMIKEAEGFDSNGFPILNVWEFYNALTWYVSHKAVSLNHQVEMQDRLRAAFIHFVR